MLLIVVTRVRDMVMLVLRMVFALCILVLMAVHFYAYIKASAVIERWFG
ncbi:MAG: hypothetical protein AB1815_04735 [Bacillota bacterium]